MRVDASMVTARTRPNRARARAHTHTHSAQALLAKLKRTCLANGLQLVDQMSNHPWAAEHNGFAFTVVGDSSLLQHGDERHGCTMAYNDCEVPKVRVQVQRSSSTI